MARRSVLFSPGDRPELMWKAPDTGADTVIFDIEDAVAPGRKHEARNAVTDVLTDEEFDPDCEVVVRINPLPTGAEDLEIVLASEPRLDAIMAPKVESGADARAVVDTVREYGFELPILTLCESARGVLAAEEIATVPGVDALVFGAEDLSADIGATRTRDGDEISYARQHVVLAGSAADVDVIDTVCTEIEDRDRISEDAAIAVQFGYDGKVAIHPGQVAIFNDAFTPDEADVEWAERILEAKDAADAEDRGVFRVDGEMIDAPLIAQAERIRERARAADGPRDRSNHSEK